MGGLTGRSRVVIGSYGNLTNRKKLRYCDAATTPCAEFESGIMQDVAIVGSVEDHGPVLRQYRSTTYRMCRTTSTVYVRLV